MAMEQRQTQVQMGAGLQESRLNTDLINFLQKYGSWALYALLVVVLCYLGWERYQEHKDRVLSEAFESYEAAAAAGKPSDLLDVAKERAGDGAVPDLARMDAATLMLDSARVGLRPGANLATPSDQDKLDDSARKSYVTQSRDILKEIVDRTAKDKDQAAVTQQARWLLATAQIDSGDFDGAKTTLEAAADAADQIGNIRISAVIRARIANLPRLRELKPLYTLTDLPESARPPKVETPAPAPIASPEAAPVATSAGTPTTPALPTATVVSGDAQVHQLTPEEAKKLKESMQGKEIKPVPMSPPAETPPPAPSTPPKP